MEWLILIPFLCVLLYKALTQKPWEGRSKAHQNVYKRGGPAEQLLNWELEEMKRKKEEEETDRENILPF